MANKTFIKSRAVYQSPVRRDQNDIELIGFDIGQARGGVYTITEGNSGSVDYSSLSSYASNAAAVTDLGVGKLYKSTTLINGSPIILITS